MLAIRAVPLGAFELQYGTGAVYPGSYRAVRATPPDLRWVGQSVAGPWHADATLVANTLNVHYNAIMQLTDFEDAVYSARQLNQNNERCPVRIQGTTGSALSHAP